MSDLTEKELVSNNFSLPCNWSKLTLEVDSTLFTDRLFLFNSMKERGISLGNVETVDKLINFVELTTSQCCQVLGLNESPLVRVASDQIIEGKYQVKGGHYSEIKVTNGDESYDGWLIEISECDVKQIADYWQSTSDIKTSSFLRKFFEARLARIIAHEVAHHKVAELFPELDLKSVEAFSELKLGRSVDYELDVSEKLAQDFEKKFLQNIITKWLGTRGDESDLEFFAGDYGEYVEAWERYLYNEM